jgi:hypothetical protein
VKPARPSLAALVAVVGWLMVVTVTRAASPSPTPAAGDPRSPGEGPGLVGEPLIAIGIVLLVGVTTALVTAVWARRSRGNVDDRTKSGA